MNTSERDLLLEVCETLAGTLHEAFWVVEVEPAGRRVLYMSPGFEAIWGRPVASVLGERSGRPALGVHPDDEARVLAAIAAAAEQQASELDYRVVRPDGAVREVRTRHIRLTPAGQVPARVLGVSSDLTEVRAAEREAVHQRQRVRLQFEAIPEPTYTYRVETDGLVLIDYNRRADTVMPGGMASWLGRRARDLFAGAPDVLATLEDCARRRETVQADLSYTLPDGGATFHVALTCTFIPPDLVQAHARDQTHYQRMLQQAEESGQRLRALLAHVSESVAIVSAEGRLEFVSPSLARSLGYGAGERLPANALDLVHPNDYAAARAVFDQARSSPGAREETALRVRRRDGEWRDMQLTLANLLADPGVHGIVLTFIDVTGRTRAERALRETAGRFRSILEATSDLITLVDATGRITYQSPSSQPMLDYPPEALLGREAAVLVHEPDLPQFRAAFQRMLLQPNEVVQGEPLRLRRRDGELISIEYSGRNLLGDPGVGAILLTGRNVTERLRAQAELRRSQEKLRVAQRMEAIGRLAGGVAHDFNNILTVIRGHLDLLLTGPPPEPAELTDQLQEARSAAERASRLTRQLLAFSRRQVLRTEVLELDDVLHELAPLLRRALSEQVELHYGLHAADATVIADRGQLEQVLLNLALNARDVMPQGGRLTLRTHCTRVESPDAMATPFPLRPGPYIMLEVEDTGSGIPAHVQPHIFEPFFTTKEPGHGTGLGLSTVYGIIKQSGGYIWARSDGERGTTFFILLPLVEREPGEAAAAEPPARAVAAPHPGTVLLVEDDDAVRQLVQRFLALSGMSVVSVPSPAEALEVVRRGQYLDVVLSDVVMPEMTGIELARRLQQHRPELPVVLMSGYAEEYRRGGESIPENTTLLEKPFTRAQVVEALRLAMTRTTR